MTIASSKARREGVSSSMITVVVMVVNLSDIEREGVDQRLGLSFIILCQGEGGAQKRKENQLDK